jgi:hypothetical protein
LARTLRTLTDSDLDSLIIWESDPRAVQMAAFEVGSETAFAPGVGAGSVERIYRLDHSIC